MPEQAVLVRRTLRESLETTRDEHAAGTTGRAEAPAVALLSGMGWLLPRRLLTRISPLGHRGGALLSRLRVAPAGDGHLSTGTGSAEVRG